MRSRALQAASLFAVVAVGLATGCSSSSPRAARHASTTVRSTTTSTTTTTPKTTTTTTTTPSVTYIVRRGDRLTGIANRLHTSITAIALANRLTNPDRLSEGQILKIPAHPPLALLVKPSQGPQGQQFQLDLIGAKASEVINFEIDSPAGKRTGPPHVATKDGSVTTKYTTSPIDQIGTYKVVATGNMGTRTQTAFAVVKHP